MNMTTVAVGILVIGLGGFFLFRSLHPEVASGKLKAMLEMWGPQRGLWMYRTAYVGIPLLLGGTLILAGLNNKSLGAFFGS